MQLEVNPALRAVVLAWRPRHVAVVVCKTTYRLEPDVCPLSDDPETPNEWDSYWNDDTSRSVASTTDLVPFKATAEVVVVGCAFAPLGTRMRSTTVHLTVGDVDKTFEAHCDRFWTPEGELVEGAPFDKMPLRYERAAGGPDTWNPVGIQHQAPPNARGVSPVPNLQPAGLVVASRETFIAPVGLGPIAPTWPSRLERLGADMRTWDPGSWAEADLPAGVDASFFNIAPWDQHLEQIRPDEAILLEGLSPEQPRLATRLPGLRPTLRAESPAGKEIINLVADTLVIDTDRRLVTVTWRGLVPLVAGVSLSLELEGSDGANVAAPADAAQWPPRIGPVSDAPIARTVDEEEKTPVPGRAAEAAAEANAPQGAPAASKSDAPAAALGGLSTTLPLSASPVATPPLGPPPLAPQAASAPPPLPSSPSPPALPLTPTPAPISPLPMAPLPGAAGAPPAAPSAVEAPRAPSSPKLPVPPPLPPSALGPAAEKVTRPSQVDIAVAPPPVARSGAPLPPPPASRPAPAPPPPPPAPRAVTAPRATPPVRPPALTPSSAPSPAGSTAPMTRPASSRPGSALAPSSDAGHSAARPLMLLAAEPTAARRLRARWPELVAEVDHEKPRAPAPGEPRVPADAASVEAAKDRRRVQHVLARAAASAVDALDDALSKAVDAHGVFEPPLALVAGDMELAFDEVEVLRATLAVVAPFATLDAQLLQAVEVANAALRTPGFERAGAMAERITASVVAAFQEPHRGLPPRFLESQTERLLVEGRCCPRRTLLGAPWLRAWTVMPGGGEPVVTYLPAAFAETLPLARRMSARFVAEVGWPQEELAGGPRALFVVALARVAPARP